MSKPGNTGIRRIIRATRFSAQGITGAWKHEAAFRQELTAAILLFPLAVWLGRDAMEILLLLMPLLLVLIVELLNSAIEAAVDRISDEHHDLAGLAKDMGSAAVFFSLLVVVAIWGTVIWQQFYI